MVRFNNLVSPSTITRGPSFVAVLTWSVQVDMTLAA